MRGKNIRKGTALLIAMVLLVSFAVPALANEQVTATVALNLRSGPGTNYPIVGELKKGETATRVGTTGNWSIILMGGSKLYASSAYLTTGSVSTSTETMRYTTIKLNVRSGPGTNFKVISQLDKGSAVSVLGTVGNWSVIRWNDSTAYVFTSYLTGSSSSSSSSGTLMMATTNVNVRTGPGTGYKVIGVLLSGETVTRLGTSGSWTKVNYKGTTAYVHSAYLKPASSTGTGTAPSSSNTFEATTTMNVRSGPGSSYSIIGSLSTGQRVTRVGTEGNWTQINFKSGTGFVITSYLKQVSSSSVNPANAMMRATSSQTVRSGAGTNFTSLGTLSSGTIVQLTGYSGSWAQIDFNGRTGYVPANTLTDAYNFNVNSASGDYMIDYMVSGRDGPGNGYPEVYLFRGGELVRRTGTSGSWTRVIFGNRSMFVPSSAITRLDSFYSADKVMFTRYAGVFYYTEPVDSGWYRYSGLSSKNEVVTVTGVGASWTRVQIYGRTYYIMNSDLWDFKDGIYKSGDSIAYSGSIDLYSDKTANSQNVTLGGSTLSSVSNSTTHTLTFIESVSSAVIKVKVTETATGNSTYAYIKTNGNSYP